eukprot:9023380-Pyramimonas_sp.AAC.1
MVPQELLAGHPWVQKISGVVKTANIETSRRNGRLIDYFIIHSSISDYSSIETALTQPMEATHRTQSSFPNGGTPSPGM